MIIECGHCKTKYQYDAERFERKPSKKIRCAKCQQVFEIQNPAFAAPEPSSPDPAEATMAGRRRTVEEALPPVEEETTASNVPMPSLDGTVGGKSQRSDAHLKLPTDRRLSLAIIEGPDAGKVFRIDKPRVVIGRSNADVVLNDIESSRNHAAIDVRETVVVLHDLGSTNGTIVDGDKISGPYVLSNQSEFQIGSTTLMLIVTDAD